MKISIIEKRILKMSGVTREYKIRNEYLRDSIFNYVLFIFFVIIIVT